MNTKKLATIAVLASLSVVLVWLVHFPIFPAVPFLEYDPADVAILICGFAYGPLAGLIATLAAALVQGFTVSAQSGLYGILMHVISTGTLMAVSSLIYNRQKTRKRAAIGIACGAHHIGIGTQIVISLAGFGFAFGVRADLCAEDACGLVAGLRIVVEDAGHADKAFRELLECMVREAVAVPVNFVIAEDEVKEVDLIE